MPPDAFKKNRQRAIDFFNTKQKLYIIDGYAGWDEKNRMKARVITTRPYHALFIKTMMIRDNVPNLVKNFTNGGPDFTIMNAGEFSADTTTESVTNKTSVNVSFTDKQLCILGTQYAGEMKKGLFGVMHYYMPKVGNLSMHASANEGDDGDTTILFGLSGTGKTTLSADPNRHLIGDDEHVWTNKGIFNIEGGCYAKAIDLSEEKEPEIYRAIKFGAILENVKYHKENDRREVNYEDTSITENTRVCYPLEHMDGVKIPAVGGHPKNIIFLTCDANGVLPPVSKLTPEQTMYHFISGYTAKVAGTEMGITEPVSTFSACFGEAFLPLHPFTYAKMLAEKCKKYNANVWLLNTGWSGGKYGVGERMSLKITRKILDAIHAGSLDNAETTVLPGFELHIPHKIDGVPTEILNPSTTWTDQDDFKATSKKLAEGFVKNFEKYADGVPEEVMT